MALDFTKLDSIATRSATADLVADEESAKRYNALESIKKERELLRKIHQQRQEDLRKTEELRLSIAKGIDGGEAPASLLLKALECISLLTGDKLTYSQYEADIVAVYGWGLRDPVTLERELEAVQARLAMLTRPELSTAPPDAQKRIHRAIEEHRALEKRLQWELRSERGGVK